MHRRGAESLDMATGPRSRSTSLTSDPQLPRINFLSPPPVNPRPAYIASSAASQIITIDQEFNSADFVPEDEHNGVAASALVTAPAVAALNGFLDHLLFNILAAAKSTRLSCIRPAVADVLKPRLAREVVSAADDELSEYTGGAAEDEEFEFSGGQEPGEEFDLIRSFKLTRLRCMVYTRLGDMEEDDEDEYIAQEGLGETESATQRFTGHFENITPAAAIFLTSIVEYIGEQALIIAGETARSRLATIVAVHNEVTEPGAERSIMNRLVVEDLDMEKLALNSTLGRLWRTWRRSLRSSTLGRAASRESFRRSISAHAFPISRKNSIATAEELSSRSVSRQVMEEETVDEEARDPASIPLPMSQHDVREIEIPGFSAEPDGEIQTLEAVVAHKVRPRSLMVFSQPSNSTRSPSSPSSSPILWSHLPGANASHHGRSMSLPNASYFADHPGGNERNEQTAAPSTPEISPTAEEERKRLETMYEHDEPMDPVAAQTGIAISTGPTNNGEAAPFGPRRAAVDSLPGEKRDLTAAQEAAVESRLSRASMEALASRASSVRTSAASANDRQQQEVVVIDGQGMREIPKQVQRPKPTPSKDPARKEGGMRPVTDDQLPSQGGAPEEPVTNRDVSWPLDTSGSATTLSVPANHISNSEPTSTKALEEEADLSGKARQASRSTSGDNERSETAGTRPNPSKLIIPSGGIQGSGKSTVSSGTERAAVQRVSTRPSPSIPSSTNSDHRRSESFSAREKRPVTSGSTTSQVSTKLKGLIGRQPGEAPSTRFRSSSETSRASGGSGDSDTLEKLIKSEETLHFTLTPKSMREMDSPDSPRVRAVPRSDNADREWAQTTGASGNGSPRLGGFSASRKPGDLASLSKSRSTELPKPAERSSLQRKPAAVQARDARLVGESTRDFADFIKSTGPPVPASPGRSDVGARKSPNVARDVNRRSKDVLSAPANGPKLEARSAVPASGHETSDLIDFIREGPPTPGVNRIPRVVAPFRDMADSEGAETSEAERRDKGRTSLASTLGSSLANKSFTSVGSRTGLLESTPPRDTTQTGPNAKVSNPSRSVSDDHLPVRKQRRVRDPYAIDFDDEDDLDEFLEPQKPEREEESLIDFLRNAPPPPDPEPSPQPFNNSPNMLRRLGKQSSAQAGLGRSSSFRQQAGSSPARQSNYAVKVGMERNGGSRGSPPGFSGRQTDTSALADFLKNTGPPEPPPAPERKDWGANSISRIFSRRKKVEV